MEQELSRDDLTGPAPVPPDGLDAVLDLIADQQGSPDRACTYLGDDREGIAAELDDLSPPWADTVRVLLAADGTVDGAALVEWDPDVGRAWIFGPWARGDGERWRSGADRLLDAVLSQVPEPCRRHELAGDVAHRLLAELAGARGWQPTEVNHAMVADADVVRAWPDAVDPRIRSATADDADAIRALHQPEFPNSPHTVDQLLEGTADGSTTVLVADGDDASRTHDGIAGYAAGRVSPDGEGYLDYVVVAPDARGRGIGRALVVAATRHLLDGAARPQVALTVQDHRAPARRLYEVLGYRTDASFVGYRDWS